MKKYLVHAIFALTMVTPFWGCDDSASASNSDTSANSQTDTLVIKTLDTLVINHVDTLVVRDSIYMIDTAHVKDTVVLHHVDTLLVKDTVYTLLNTICGDEEYDPETQYCKDGEITSKLQCRYDFYNPETEICDIRDGQIYKTVKIGDQTWMAQNLNFRYVYSTDSSSFCYNNDTHMCEKYGRLYTWSAALDSMGLYSKTGKGCGKGNLCNLPVEVRGICPAGWHIPSREDWDVLVEHIGGLDSAAYKLKTNLGWYNALMDSVEYHQNYTGVDEYGFSALPAGHRYGDGGMSPMGSGSYFWSTSLSSYTAHVLKEEVEFWNPETFFFIGDDLVAKFTWMSAETAQSVRCLKDKN